MGMGFRGASSPSEEDTPGPNASLHYLSKPGCELHAVTEWLLWLIPLEKERRQEGPLSGPQSQARPPDWLSFSYAAGQS